MDLTSAQRKYLRSEAHHLKPVVHVGKAGVTDGLTGRLDAALDEHELIKMRFVEHKGEKKELAEAMAKATKSEVVGVIGNIAILFREHRDPEKRVVFQPASPTGKLEKGRTRDPGKARTHRRSTGRPVGRGQGMRRGQRGS